MGCLRGCHSCGFDLAGSIESKLSGTMEASLRIASDCRCRRNDMRQRNQATVEIQIPI